MWVQQVCEKDVAAGRRGLMRRRILNGWANKKDSHERNKLPSVTSQLVYSLATGNDTGFEIRVVKG